MTPASPTLDSLYFVGGILAATVLPWAMFTRVLTDLTRARIWLSISARCQANGEAALRRRDHTLDYLAQAQKKLDEHAPKEEPRNEANELTPRLGA